MEKSYLKVDNYLKEQILKGELQAGDELPPERELAQILDVSRNSVREGLRILENMGVIASQQGSGNYISNEFDDAIVSVMSSMYVLKDLNMDQITDFRYALEWQAINLAVLRITESQKKRLFELLEKMEQAETEKMRVAYDKEIHYQLIEASGNDYMLVNFKALASIMDRYIFQMRGKIIQGMNSDEDLTMAHRMMIEGVAEGDREKGQRGLDLHYTYIYQFKNT